MAENTICFIRNYLDYIWLKKFWALVCHEVWFSCVEVAGIKLGGNEPEPEWKYKYLYSKTYSRYTYFFENYQGMFLYVLYFGI